MKRKNNKIIITLIICLGFFTNCSTKKKTWVHRNYHNITAKYNGYFNAKESLKIGEKKITEKHEDDYTKTLPVYKTGDLKKETATHIYMDKAIKKGSVVIQRHSIRIRGKEYCKWIDDSYLLIGKAYFYKGDFENAIKSFNFVKNEYKKNPIRFEASLWLIRAYSEKEDFIAAEVELTELEKNRKTPKKIKKELNLVAADFYLKQENYSLALESLKKAIAETKKSKNKSRLHYICGQILQEHNSFKQAAEHYKQSLKGSQNYETTFNAKMNIARFLERNKEEEEKTEQKLLKMLRDDKNREYLDQIYFTLAEIQIAKEDTAKAIDYYKQSTQNSIKNYSQKTLSFLALGKINFEQEKYLLAKNNYDSVVFYMQENHKNYLEIKDKKITLEELSNHLQTIIFEDSVQQLSELPEKELQLVLTQIIERERQKEALKQEQRQNMYQTNRFERENQQFGNKTSGGNWYFYNPATLSFGLSEFRKKWGKRKLEDDWRRQDKSVIIEKDSTEIQEKNQEINNRRDPAYYANQLPKTKEEKEKSNMKIKEAYYQSGIIYREQVINYKKSTKQFLTLLKRFPLDKQYSAKTLYNLFLNYTHEGNIQKIKETTKEIEERFPESIYAKLIKNKDYVEGEKSEITEKNYQKTYRKYIKRKYNEVIQETINIQEDKYKYKYKYIRAISLLKTKDTIAFKKEINELVKQKNDTIISRQAKKISEILANPSSMDKINTIATNKTPYLDIANTPHSIMILLPKEGVEVNYLKALISDFNTQNFAARVFEIKAILLGLENHLIIVKPFENKMKARDYYNTLFANQTITKELKNTAHKTYIISDENFIYFYKNKDLKGYTNFFKKKYKIDID